MPASLAEYLKKGRHERFIMESTADMIAAHHLAAVRSDQPPPANGRHNADVQRLVKKRWEAGCTRHCLGPLTLENINVEGETPKLTRIESDPVDVVSDLAGLLVELELEGQREMANILFNRYFDVTGGVLNDPGTLTMLRDQMNVRSADRRGADSAAPTGGSALVAVGGLSGGGKSRMSRQLAPLYPTPPGARVVRTDVVRKRMMGVALTDRLKSHGYTDTISEKAYALFYDELARGIEQGHPVIADGVFARPEQRAGVEALARRLGVPFIGLWVSAPPHVRAKRVATRKRNVSDVTQRVVERQLAMDLGEISWSEIDSSGPREETIARGREIVGL